MPSLVCIATFPGREEVITKAVASLLSQADELHVYANGEKYAWVPPAGVILHHVADRGDASKFTLACEGRKGYLFTCDDDLIYPPDYVARMITHLDKLGRVAVGVHATRFIRSPPRHFVAHREFRDRDVRPCLGPAVHTLRKEHLLGTGTLAFRASSIKLAWDCFENGFMADIWFALQAQYQQLPLFSVPRKEGWIQAIRPPPEDTIAKRTRRKGDSVQVATLARIKDWKLW